jgi:hypothetical protein
MRLKFPVTLAVLAVATACSADSTTAVVGEASMDRASSVNVCHANGGGIYNLISVGANALAPHMAHGDVVPGDAVPGVFGMQFNDACVAVAAGPDFFTFYIRNTGGSITDPWDATITLSENAVGDGFTFGTPQSGQKVGYGTSFFDGLPLNTVNSVNWTAVSGMSGGIIPYLNIWVTDGVNYAVIASENFYPGTDFQTRTEWKVFETPGAGPADCASPCAALAWLFDDGAAAGRTSQYLTRNGTNATLADLGDNIVILSPTIYLPPIGTGAPRGGYGFNLIWGDTQANFTQPVGQISNLTVTVAGTTFNASN